MKDKRVKHGIEKHPLYAVWSGMIRRCYSLTFKSYPAYGGSGVTVCDEWRHNVTAFYNWAINNGWAKGLQLDKDKLSPFKTGIVYSPEFCCFLTPKENMSYTKSSRMVLYRGETKPLQIWIAELGLNQRLIEGRYKQGWDNYPEELFETPKIDKVRLPYKDQALTISEWSKVTGLSIIAINKRIKRGWDINKILETPSQKTKQLICTQAK